MLGKQLTEKMYYTIGEVASAFNVNTSLIRFWEKEFDVLSPKKTAKGNRKYSKKDIEIIKSIYHLVKERGFTLEGAREHLKKRKGELKTTEIIEKLEFVKDELLRIKNEM
ncbi:MAG: MerR family transcriptional regulator [Nonlabens sp.]